MYAMKKARTNSEESVRAWLFHFRVADVSSGQASTFNDWEVGVKNK
jgi:hypothetical protein